MWFNSTKMIAFTLLVAFAPLLLAAAPGCHRGEQLGKITGRVTLDGKPISPGIVMFCNFSKGVHITALLDGEGKYELQTAKGFGLPLGSYRVAVSPLPPEPPIPGGPPAAAHSSPLNNIPPRYLDPETSELETTVEAGENVYNIELQSK